MKQEKTARKKSKYIYRTIKKYENTQERERMKEETTTKRNYFDLRQADVLNQTRLRPLHLDYGHFNMSNCLFSFSE